MKRLLLILAAILALLVAALAVFIATFDADRYRPLLVSKLEEAAGRPVRLERLSLGWRRGIALELKGFTILEGREAGREPLIQMDSASALIEPIPLFRKHLRVSSVVLRRPRIHAGRDAQGAVNLTGLAAAGAPAAGPHTKDAGGGAVTFQVASLRIEGGTVHWTDAMTTPPTELWLKSLDVAVRHIAPGEPMAIELSGALVGEAPNLRLTARLTPPDGRQAGSLGDLKVSLQRIPLERLLPPAASGEPQLRGNLTVTIEGSAETLEPADLLRAVSGHGTLHVDEPVIANLNVLRAVFEKLSVLPGLVQALEARLPPESQAKLAARDTMLEPIDLTVHAEAGRLRFDDLNVRSDTFGLSGRGTVDADGTLNVQALLRVEPQLSTAIVRGVNELQALANRTGELELPLAVQGVAPRVAVWPDVNYVASRVLARKAADLLAGTDQTQQGSGGLLGQVLQRVLDQRAAPAADPAKR